MMLSELLSSALAGRALTFSDGVALMHAPPDALPDVFATAAALRDRGHGRVVTFSAKVFVPLTNLCRDYCGYCTFRRDAGEPGARTLEAAEVVELCRAAESMGIKEALFSLGDRPEAAFPEHRAWLAERGYGSTLAYLASACREVVEQTGLLPHANPGLLASRDLVALRPVNASMGLMLESTSERLLEAGQAHDRAPDKVPRHRLRTLEAAGALRIPMTTGILIGLGETSPERVEALLAIRALHERHGHIQEVIVQNFRAKPAVRMRGQPDPSFQELQRTVAVARLLLGARANVQAPPNLSPATYPELIRAGLNDWGGISPLTIDHINPEAPWPMLVALHRATSALGYELRERLTVYPEYIVDRPDYLHDKMRERALTYTGHDGLVRPELERWRQW